MNSLKQSALLVKLGDPTRLSMCETSMVSLAQSITDPNMNYLINPANSPVSRNHWVANVGSTNVKTGSRALDGHKIISIPQTTSSNTYKKVLLIEEWKQKTLVPYHIHDTVFYKNYAECVVNGGNKKARQKEVPFTDLLKNIKLKLGKANKIDEVRYLFVSDNLSIQAQEEITKFNSYGKYIVQQSTGKQIPVRIKYLSFYQYIKNIDNNYGIHWSAIEGLVKQLNQFSTYNNQGGMFYSPKTNKYISVSEKYIIKPSNN